MVETSQECAKRRNLNTVISVSLLLCWPKASPHRIGTLTSWRNGNLSLTRLWPLASAAMAGLVRIDLNKLATMTNDIVADWLAAIVLTLFCGTIGFWLSIILS